MEQTLSKGNMKKSFAYRIYTAVVALGILVSIQLASVVLGSFIAPSCFAKRTTPVVRRLFATDPDSREEGGPEVEAKMPGTRNPFRLAVLKLGMTEPAWSSPLNYKKMDGSYNCASCGTVLFDSKGKYDSGTGWPSYWKTAGEDRVALRRELDGRMECICKTCSGHLGHVFPDGPKRVETSKEELDTIPQSDLKCNNPARLPRYCVNGASLIFKKRKS
eukprot:scaffold216547_cov51-Attheya_sp.AAC.2